MNSTVTAKNTAQSGFKLKASSLTFTVIQLTSVSLEMIHQQLHSMAEATPNFFNATPVLIDLTLVEKLQLTLDIASVANILKTHRMVPIGIKTSNEAYISTAKAIGIANINYSTLAPKSKGQSKEQPREQEVKAKTSNAALAPKDFAPNEQIARSEVRPGTMSNMVETKVIDQTVRSGKQIYAKGCDLIINASVSHGAEVLADGNIHIYGTLNGRALAGVQGNNKARIYCKSLNAELVAIAGNYLVNEQIPDQYKNLNQILAIHLDGQNLDFNKI